MTDVLTLPKSRGDDAEIVAMVTAETPRLRAFARRHAANLADAEDVVQETFYELVAAYRLMQPVERAAAWLVRVARHRIIDRFRARAREAAVIDRYASIDDEPERVLDGWLAPVSGGPEAAYAREALAEELEAALDELPTAQRDAFVAHEFEGRSFRELAAASGESISTLLGRKHAAVLHLRRRLKAIYDEINT